MVLVFNKSHYNSGEGMLTSVWGPALWHVLHTISFNYPVKPSSQQKRDYKNFLLLLEKVLPCIYCRDNFSKNCKKAKLCDGVFKNRASFSRFIYNLHCSVNKGLGKPKCDSFSRVRDRYEHFRAHCVKRKTPSKKSRKGKEKGCVNSAHKKGYKCVLTVVPKKSRKKLAKKSRKKLAKKSRKKLAKKSRKKLAKKSRKKLARKLARKSRKSKFHMDNPKLTHDVFYKTSTGLYKLLRRDSLLNLGTASKEIKEIVSKESLSFSGSNMDNNYVSSFPKMMAFIIKNKPTDTSGHIRNITKIKIYDMDLMDRTDSAEWLPDNIEKESRVGKLVRVLGAFDIKYLEMKGCRITDITSLSALSQLETLNIERNKIIDIRGLAALTQLKELYLEGNEIIDIKGLSALTRLKTLDLRNNEIIDIKGLAALTRLKTLNLGFNHITDIASLSSLTQLKTLDLMDNKITYITSLSALTQLKTLDLSSNRITDIKSLTALTQLETLNISENKITDVTGLSTLTQLEHLDFSYNKITDMEYTSSRLSTLTQLKTLNEEQ